MKTLVLALTAAVLSGVQGCDGREPRVRSYADVAGEYVLVEQNGRPLPQDIPVEIRGRACTSTLVRMVMTLREDGTWTEEGEARTSCPGEPPSVEPLRTDEPYTYTLRGPAGDTVVLGSTDVPGEPPSTGVLVGDELRITLASPSVRDTVSYRYVRQPRPD